MAVGFVAAGSVAEAVAGADIVVTMLPAGPHVLSVYSEQIIGTAPKTTLLLDCSTIDVDTARKVAALAKAAGYAFADAPVSGGAVAADAGTLAFMVGCDEADFARVEPALEPMSRVTMRAGDHGAGQAAKICQQHDPGHHHDRHLRGRGPGRETGSGPSQILRHRVEVVGQSWSVSNYYPWPGPVPTAP